MNFQKTFLLIMLTVFLVSCDRTTVYTGPSVEIKKVGKVYVNFNSKREIVVGGELTIADRAIKKLGNIGWDAGFEHTFNEARSTSNKLYILWDDGSGNIVRETYTFDQPFEVEFASDEWVGRIAHTGDGTVVAYVDRSVFIEEETQEDGQFARISGHVEEVNLRSSPGYAEKDDAKDVIIKIPSSAIVEVVDGPKSADGLDWWHVSWNGYTGWIAEYTGNGRKIMIFNP